VWPAIGWLVFPVVPSVLAITWYQAVNFGGADPRDWAVADWAILLGPLLGYGFLAGSTARLPDDHPAGWRGLCHRRASWVAVGPWLGFVVCAGLLMLRHGIGRLLGSERWPEIDTRTFTVLIYVLLGTISYGWVLVAAAAVRRARRAGELARSLARGLATALSFVGSLVGSFWAVTSVWRWYFFDPTVVRTVLLAASGTLLLAGCAPLTAGELRRRKLFEAMLLAWVIGLALIWRWWSRRQR
jgi:hypothetical protein